MFAVSLIFGRSANSQSIEEIFVGSPGLQASVTQGYTALNEFGINYMFRLYNYTEFSKDHFGELSLSTGVISSLNAKNRITPLDYRWGFKLSGLGIPEPRLFDKKSPVFTYAGLGLLYSQPIEVQSANDPLVPDQGSTIGTSSFWDFDGGIAPFIPMGAGLEVPLDIQTKLNLSVGYNQVINSLKLNPKKVPEGYWTFSVGINFYRQKNEVKPAFDLQPVEINRSLPKPGPVAVAQFKLHLPEVSRLDPIHIGYIQSRNINFELLSSQIKPDYHRLIADAALFLKVNPDINLEVVGHADSTGSDRINRMISESRSRAVWLALMEEGIAPERVKYIWYSDKRPLIDTRRDTTEEARNRRVEFELLNNPVSLSKNASTGENAALAVPGEVFSHNIRYWTMLNYTDMEQVNRDLNRLARILEMNQELAVQVNYTGIINTGLTSARELKKARAEKIKAELIELGISPDRITAVNPYTRSIETESLSDIMKRDTGGSGLLISFTNK